MVDHEFTELKISQAVEAVADFDRTNSREAAISAAWACRRLVILMRESGTRLHLPERVRRACAGFR